MSILKRRRVASLLKRKLGNSVREKQAPPKIAYNPYKKKLTIQRHQKIRTRSPQFKLRSQPQTCSAWVGDDLSAHPPPSLTRFLLQNCNGLPLMRDTNYFKSTITELLANDVHFMGLPEINVNCINHELINGYKEAFTSIVSDGIFTTTNSSIFEGTHKFQPGGVATGFFGRLVTRYVGHTKDKYGRWHAQEFHGKHQNLKIYTLYRTNYRTDNNSGNITSWAQQRLLLQQDGIQTNPRHHVIEAFIKEITNTIEKGYSAIVLTDLNEHIDGAEGTNTKLCDAGLINLFQKTLGNNIPKTHKRGSSAIDHVFLTPNIYPFVKKAGMAPFGFGLRSDHRALIFDIDLGGLLDPEVNIVPPFNRRRLKATVPKRMEKYLKILNKKWEEHKINERLNRIEHVVIKNNNSTEIEKELNNLDEFICGLMKFSEKNCAKAGNHHTLPWSPDLHYAILHVRNCIDELKESLYIDPDISMSQQITTYQKAEKNLQEARNNYTEVKNEAEKHREDFMKDKVEFHHNKTGAAPKSILKALKHIEHQQKSSAKIGFALEKNQRRGITHIYIPAKEEYEESQQSRYKNIQTMWERIEHRSGKDITKWEQISNRAEVEELLIKWQQHHFRQAGETPLASFEWKKIFIDEEKQEQLLNGSFIPHTEIPEECNELLEFMKCDEKIRNQVNHKTSISEFITFIKNAKEKSACSPSGRSYSHYKTLLENRKILEVLHRIFELALDNNIILKRWAQTITTLIPKDEGLIYIHRLRAIHVVEAELQFFSKIIYAKRMVKVAEKHNAITDEQYGGRKGRRAQSVVLNKILYYAISHQKRMDAAFLDNDAKACYDRIVPSLAGIETRKWGLSKKTVDITRSIIENQQFKVKTAHGVSGTSYQYSNDDQLYGVGQGLGWSGAIWMATSNTICDVLKAKCAGMRFISPNKQIIVHKMGDLFVDDTALGVTSNCVPSYRTVCEQLTLDAQRHSFTLFSEGHRLSLPKCCWYLAKYKRVGTHYKHLMCHEAPGRLLLKEGFDKESKEVK